jgi:shikimate dehydrogenase
MTVRGDTAVYAVLGDPVKHSLSPVLHNAWMAEAGLNAVYVPLRVAPAAFERFAALGLAGANVTVPYKESAALAADTKDSAVATLAAANVLRLEPDGRVAAFNTDAGGFVASLDEGAPGWRSRVGHALVIGAGGAGRAIAFGLAAAGVPRLTILNRDEARAAAAAAIHSDRARSAGWRDLPDAIAEADLIVNATSLGLGGAAVEWPLHRAQDDALVVDAVYAPLETGLLRLARSRGLATLDGLGMLIHQAALAFDLWFGVRPDTVAGRARALAALKERET